MSAIGEFFATHYRLIDLEWVDSSANRTFEMPAQQLLGIAARQLAAARGTGDIASSNQLE
jgi:hypothetical protein